MLGYVGVDLGSLDAGVAERVLNHAGVGTGFQQVRGCRKGSRGCNSKLRLASSSTVRLGVKGRIFFG